MDYAGLYSWTTRAEAERYGDYITALLRPLSTAGTAGYRCSTSPSRTISRNAGSDLAPVRPGQHGSRTPNAPASHPPFGDGGPVLPGEDDRPSGRLGPPAPAPLHGSPLHRRQDVSDPVGRAEVVAQAPRASSRSIGIRTPAEGEDGRATLDHAEDLARPGRRARTQGSRDCGLDGELPRAGAARSSTVP